MNTKGMKRKKKKMTAMTEITTANGKVSFAFWLCLPHRCGRGWAVQFCYFSGFVGRRSEGCLTFWPFCSLWIGPLSDLKSHKEKCPLGPVACPNGCKSRDLVRKDLKEHIEEYCPLAKIICVNWKLGCSLVASFPLSSLLFACVLTGTNKERATKKERKNKKQKTKGHNSREGRKALIWKKTAFMRC